MTTSPHWAPPAAPQDSDDYLDVDLLVDESRPLDALPSQGGAVVESWTPQVHDEHGTPEHTGSSQASTADYVASDGTPGRGIIVSAGLASAALAVLDLALVGRLSVFFDLSFVVVCLVAALAVRPRDFFTAAVLPPLAFGGTIAGVALLWPDTIATNLGLVATFLAGLATHALGLVFGYAAALLTVGARVYARRRT
jgi:uncharacterized protein DUF6542